MREFGAEPTGERVTIDGNIITGGGVTAGIDFALRVVEQLRGKAAAEAIQLMVEYDPHPPFDAGSPRNRCCASARPPSPAPPRRWRKPSLSALPANCLVFRQGLG